ncbi:MAG: Na(+)-translocating NADH-quinone reductase subunit C [Desulfobulbaceae bacterium]|nr:Na(+)-translocating NADH-quinone reductase subunit C [Desulfobulbaceae bacterium]
MADESAAKPFYSVLVLAFVCSFLVSGAAIGLRPLQEANRRIDMKKNILRAGGLYETNKPVDALFSSIETRVIELASGEFIPEDQIAPESYNQLKAALSNDLSRHLDRKEDIAGLRRLEKYSLVYLVRSGTGIEQIILPVRGKGLWSTMYGYLALDADLKTIRGISFYQHGETPGLGGEIENEQWQAGWAGKKMYGPDDNVSLQVAKGKAPTTGKAAQYQVDGLSGATMTAEGVNDLMHFWFGDHGFKPFIERLQKSGGING